MKNLQENPLTVSLPQTILRLPVVKSTSGLSRSSPYARIADHLWPKPVNLGGRAVGWPASEVAAINAARIAGKSNNEVRQLVADLEAARKVMESVSHFIDCSKDVTLTRACLATPRTLDIPDSLLSSPRS